MLGDSFHSWPWAWSLENKLPHTQTEPQFAGLWEKTTVGIGGSDGRKRWSLEPLRLHLHRHEHSHYQFENRGGIRAFPPGWFPSDLTRTPVTGAWSEVQNKDWSHQQRRGELPITPEWNTWSGCDEWQWLLSGSFSLRPTKPRRAELRGSGSQRAALAERLTSSRLTSAVRIPTTPLRPGRSGSFGHEGTGSMPKSRIQTAAVHCHVLLRLQSQRPPPADSELNG